MAEIRAAAPYSMDTNSFMDWQARWYPTDVFPGVVARVSALVSTDRLFAAALVQEELEVVGTPELVEWAKSNKRLFVPTPSILVEALSIQNQFPGLRDPKAEHAEAAAYVIAIARMRDGIVVTQETPAAEKNRPRRSHFIPDVCRELGVPCISLLGLMRRERWAFS